MNFFKNLFKEREDHSDITNIIIEDWEKNPMDWHISEYSVSNYHMSIWIANSPYADMKLNGMRLPNRALLRKKLLELNFRQLKEKKMG